MWACQWCYYGFAVEMFDWRWHKVLKIILDDLIWMFYFLSQILDLDCKLPVSDAAAAVGVVDDVDDEMFEINKMNLNGS